MPEGGAARPTTVLTTRLRAAADWRTLLEIFVLTGFVVAQPVLDVLGRAPEFLVFRGAERGDIVVLATLVVLVPPVALGVLELLAGLVLGDRARRTLHRILVAVLFALLGAQVAKTAGAAGTAPVVAAALAVGAGLYAVYLRSDTIRSWLAFLTPAPLIFAGLFLLVSPVSDLVVPGNGAAAFAAGRSPDTPVVVLFLDEFPAMSLLDSTGHVDRRVFPNFGRLAERSTWLRNTTGVAGYTPTAVPAMLTGTASAKPKAPAVTQYPENLFTWLGGAYQVNALETVTALCPASVCDERSETGETGLGALIGDSSRLWWTIASPSSEEEDVEGSVDEETEAERAERTGGSVDSKQREGDRSRKLNQPARFNQFVRLLDGDAPPTLNFLHLLMPHAPHRYLPNGMQYPLGRLGKEPNGDRVDDPWPNVVQRQRYLLQLAYTDGLLGQVIDKLESEGMWDDALVMVVADHGINFQPGGRTRSLRGPDDPGVPELAFVPFFVKRPHQEQGAIDDRSHTTLDVVPTIADVLDVDLPWDVQGRSVFDEGETPTVRRFLPRTDVDTVRWFPVVLEGVTDRLARPDLGPDGLYRVGAWADLVDTPLDTYTVAPPSGGVAAIASPEDPASADPARGIVPALVVGAVTETGDVGDAVGVAVAINGRVGAVSLLFDDRSGENRFAAVSPPGLFRQGRNQLELFLVSGTPGAPVLHPLSVE